MLLNDDGDFNANVLPFAASEIATDVNLDSSIIQSSQQKNQRHKRHKLQKRQNNDIAHDKNNKTQYNYSYIYFENMKPEDNHVTFIPYTGPCNTNHLHRGLYLPQLTPNIPNDMNICAQRFLENYENVIKPISISTDSMSLSVFLRFGISYIINLGSLADQTLKFTDFVDLRRKGKSFRTAFYTCKGVTSPKRLVTAVSKLNYHEIASNKFTYDIQLYGVKPHQRQIIHFRFDEQLQCISVCFRSEHPVNFDFIRNKMLSSFRSVDDSYYDTFDFRIQLSQIQYLSRTDPIVLGVLRGVPIDQILFFDKSTQGLHVSPKLHNVVKYLKCTRSTIYENTDEQVLISMGTYEEFHLNQRGQCESLMKASNTITIELLNLKSIPPGKKLYDIGEWFSTLCQGSVDLPAMSTGKNLTKSIRWFSGISLWRKRSNQSIKQMSVNELTTYKTNKSKKSYTSVELAFVKKILQEENLQNILLNSSEQMSYNKREIEQTFENIMKRLKTNAAPSASEAMEKVQRAYELLCKQFVDSER